MINEEGEDVNCLTFQYDPSEILYYEVLNIFENKGKTISP